MFVNKKQLITAAKAAVFLLTMILVLFLVGLFLGPEKNFVGKAADTSNCQEKLERLDIFIDNFINLINEAVKMLEGQILKNRLRGEYHKEFGLGKIKTELKKIKGEMGRLRQAITDGKRPRVEKLIGGVKELRLLLKLASFALEYSANMEKQRGEEIKKEYEETIKIYRWNINDPQTKKKLWDLKRNICRTKIGAVYYFDEKEKVERIIKLLNVFVHYLENVKSVCDEMAVNGNDALEKEEAVFAAELLRAFLDNIPIDDMLAAVMVQEKELEEEMRQLHNSLFALFRNEKICRRRTILAQLAGIEATLRFLKKRLESSKAPRQNLVSLVAAMESILKDIRRLSNNRDIDFSRRKRLEELEQVLKREINSLKRLDIFFFK